MLLKKSWKLQIFKGGELYMPEFDSSAVVSGLTTATTNVLGLMMDLLPIALGVFAATWGVKKAIGFFKKNAA